MKEPDIAKLSQKISDAEKESIRNISHENLKKRISNLDLNEVAKTMRKLNLNDAADKLETMTGEDIMKQISKNPEIIDKLKGIFK